MKSKIISLVLLLSIMLSTNFAYAQEINLKNMSDEDLSKIQSELSEIISKKFKKGYLEIGMGYYLSEKDVNIGSYRFYPSEAFSNSMYFKYNIRKPELFDINKSIQDMEYEEILSTNYSQSRVDIKKAKKYNINFKKNEFLKISTTCGYLIPN